MNILNKIKSEKPQTTKGFTYYKPAVDIYENENELKIIFDVPGVDKEKINIKVDNDILTVTADIEQIIPEKAQPVSIEYNFGNYSRSFTLPDYVDTEKIAAKYKNGALELTLPKVEAVKPKQIKIDEK